VLSTEQIFEKKRIPEIDGLPIVDVERLLGVDMADNLVTP
jgi:hypothetical protein